MLTLGGKKNRLPLKKFLAIPGKKKPASELHQKIRENRSRRNSIVAYEL